VTAALSINKADSQALAQIRATMRSCGFDRRMTPLRMGRFAGERAIHVVDFGAHSVLWRRLFKRGYMAGRSYRDEMACAHTVKVNP
jgi:hypothetical protein